MKKYLIKTLKIVTIGFILSAGFALAQVVTQTWVSPVGVPPVGNISAPVNSGPYDQVRTGGLGAGPLTVFGNSSFYGKQSIFSNGNIYNLYVSGKTSIGHGVSEPYRAFEINNDVNPLDPNGPVVTNYVKTTSLVHSLALPAPYQSSNSNLREVCSNSAGVLVFCPIHTPTPEPINDPGSKTWVSPGVYTFTVPYGFSSLTVETWGGGGGGAGGTNTDCNSGKGCGGSGGYGGIYKTETYSIPDGAVGLADLTVLTINVGGGGSGSGGQPYNDGSYIISSGGAGGASSVQTGASYLAYSAGGGGAPMPNYNNSVITGSSGYASSNGGYGGAGGTDPGCNNAGNPGDPGGAPSGGGGGGSGGRQCGAGGKHSGGSGGYGASGQVKISWN